MPDTSSANDACPDCGAAHTAADNYCRNCGMYLALTREVAVSAPSETRALERPRASLPAPVKRAATAVAVGTVLHIGTGLAGKFLLRQAARAVTPSFKPRKPVSQETRAVTKPAEASRPPAIVVSEALYVRKTWIQRD